MRIASIELNGFIPMLSVNGIKHFKMTPKERIQLILGQNGSGKSSLIAELTPMPAVQANYTKDGSKIIEIESAGNKYILTSDFSCKHIHSFVRIHDDGEHEEMNEGGTASVQRELVWQYFQVTAETHDICTGVERFTTMAPSRKRQILTSLSDTSFDYALRVFAKLKEELSTAKHSLKTAKQRLVTETAKRADEQEVARIQTEIQSITADIDILYRNRTYDTKTVRELENEREEMEAKLAALSRKILQFKFQNEQAFTPEEIASDIELKKIEIGSITALMQEMTREHAQLKETHDAFLKTGMADVGTLKTRISDLQTKRNELLAMRKLGLEFTDSLAAKNAIDTVECSLSIIFVEFPENASRTLSNLKLEEWRQKNEENQLRMAAIRKELERVQHIKQHLDNIRKGDETECPQCNHKWHPGFKQSTYDLAVKAIEDQVDKLQACEVVQKDITSHILANENYATGWREFLGIVRSTPVLQPFWTYLKDNDIIHAFPRQAQTRVEQLMKDLEFSVQAAELNKEIDKQKDLLELALKASDANVANVTERLERTELRLGELTGQLSRLQQQLQTASTHLLKTREFLSNDEQVRQLLGRLKTSQNESLRVLKNEIITRCLNEAQIELARRQNLLNDIRMQQAIVDDIAEQVKILEQRELVYRLLVDELSPTDGLIAEGLLGFIRVFVRKMNSVIKKIWLYRLEVQDCSVGDGDTAELDYKFPLLVNDESSIVPDLSRASTGQKEVVDLAFRIVATSYYGLNDAPLFLDEWAASFDAEHRVTAAQAIKSILESVSFSQLFMVSHYEGGHGVFTNAEVCVISKKNTVVPTKGAYNKHVEIA